MTEMHNSSAISVYSCMKSAAEIDELCISAIVMTVLTSITLLISIVSLVQHLKSGASWIQYQILIHYSVIIQCICLLVYFSIFADFYVHTLYELLKLFTFIFVGYFFTFSAYKMGLTPDCCSKCGLHSTFIVYILFVIAGTAVMIYFQDTCKNVGRLMFASAQFGFAGFFGVVSYWILRTANHATSKKTALSQNFMIRHTRPLTIVLIIYTWTSVVNLGLQIFLFSIAKENKSCHIVLEEQDEGVVISYPIFKEIDNLVPLWAILWYFYTTKKKDLYFVAHTNNPLPSAYPYTAQSQSLPPPTPLPVLPFAGYNTGNEALEEEEAGLSSSFRNTFDSS
eukprot:TRINITY_DN28054_c0_g1_i1.p1 TRINITY_DN28054_c0_g1~~TRINITY_DN28054_c0_g1_i1.p1  ORF type:complete len:350 (-),score=67.47 TRINITY_DN28054_c0_g1_i1:79-1092(-)